MNLKDEIVEQVRAAREAYAARNYDLAEMYKDLKAKEQARNRNIAPLKPVEPQRDATLPSSGAHTDGGATEIRRNRRPSCSSGKYRADLSV